MCLLSIKVAIRKKSLETYFMILEYVQQEFILENETKFSEILRYKRII